MIDIGIITGSGVYEVLEGAERHIVKSRFGEVEVAVAPVGPWVVGSIARHLKGHHHLPHNIPHKANLMALKQLGAQAILATTVVGAVDPRIPLGEPIVFDDLFFPENRLPNGKPCTIFTEPGAPERGHLIQSEPYSPRLRRKIELAAKSLGLKITAGGIYGHVNGPRFNTRAEINSLASAGVTAVSQTCGPEAVLAGELELSYGLVGFPVNYAAGLRESEPAELERLLARAPSVLPRLVLRTVALLEREDLPFDYGYVYRIEGRIG